MNKIIPIAKNTHEETGLSSDKAKVSILILFISLPSA
jgi:hypothetical protein